MSSVRSLMSLAVFVALLWTISASQVSLEESADEGEMIWVALDLSDLAHKQVVQAKGGYD